MPLKPLPRSLAEPGGAQAHHLHDTGLELASGTRRRPHQQHAAVICSVSQASCSDGRVRRHPREVSPLSRGVISLEGSTPIRPITGRRSLSPSSSTRRPIGDHLAAGLPRGEDDGLTTFRRCSAGGEGRSSPPVVRHLRLEKVKPPDLTTYLLVQACQHLWLASSNGLYQHFTWVDLTRTAGPRPP